MASVPGYIPVKEYAARKGITVQAAYKQIRAGRLECTEITEAGRAVKYVREDADGSAGNRASADAQAAPDPEPQATEADASPSVLDLLGAQLQEKDKQISQLMDQVAKLTELLRQSQQLQAHTQHLLEQHNPDPAGDVIEAQATETPASDEPPKKRRSWWAWLFGEVE